MNEEEQDESLDDEELDDEELDEDQALEQEYIQIQDEFEEFADKINEQLAIAAEAINKANKIGQEAGLEYITEGRSDYNDLSKEDRIKIELIDFSGVYRAMSNSGWSMSSIGC
jgi:hypothetical protein